MKVKIFTSYRYDILEDEINEFIKSKQIINISMSEDANEKTIAALILYKEEIEELEDMEIDKILIENAEKINKITKLVPTDLKAGEKFETICPNCGAKLEILRENPNGHLWIVCEKEGVLFCE